MKRPVIFAAAALLFVACATPRHQPWYKAGAGSGDWERDIYECERDASFVGAMTGEMIARCLRAKGWTLK